MLALKGVSGHVHVLRRAKTTQTSFMNVEYIVIWFSFVGGVIGMGR